MHQLTHHRSNLRLPPNTNSRSSRARRFSTTDTSRGAPHVALTYPARCAEVPPIVIDGVFIAYCSAPAGYSLRLSAIPSRQSIERMLVLKPVCKRSNICYQVKQKTPRFFKHRHVRRIFEPDELLRRSRDPTVPIRAQGARNSPVVPPFK